MTRYYFDHNLAQELVDSTKESLKKKILEDLAKLEPGTPVVIAYRQENDPISNFQAVGYLTGFKLDDKNIVLGNGINLLPRGISADNYTIIEIPTEYFLSYSMLTILTTKDE